MTTITGIHNNGYYDSIQDTDLQQKLNTTKFWSIYKLNTLFAMFSTILDLRSHYQKSQKLQPWFPIQDGDLQQNLELSIKEMEPQLMILLILYGIITTIIYFLLYGVLTKEHLK